MVNNPIYIAWGGGGLYGLCKFHNRTQIARHVCAGGTALPPSLYLPFSLSISALPFPFLFSFVSGHVWLLPNGNGVSTLLFTGHFYWELSVKTKWGRTRNVAALVRKGTTTGRGGGEPSTFPCNRWAIEIVWLSTDIKSKRHIKLETAFGSINTLDSNYDNDCQCDNNRTSAIAISIRLQFDCVASSHDDNVYYMFFFFWVPPSS